VSRWRVALAGVALASALAMPVVADEPVRALFAERCGTCHALGPVDRPMQGPRLDGLIGRPVAGIDGFDYSLALEKLGKAGLVWDAPTLARYLADPRGVAPNGFMAQPRLSDAERSAIVALLAATPMR
jgi:cytochrome c